MYRAVTFVALRDGVGLDDEDALSEIAAHIELRFEGDSVFVDGENVTLAIRKPEVTRKIKSIADAVQVRRHLVALQQKIAATGDFISEGRDQGTVAFPDATCKIYLTASTRFRAVRRALQLEQQGIKAGLEEVIAEINSRDYND